MNRLKQNTNATDAIKYGRLCKIPCCIIVYLREEFVRGVPCIPMQLCCPMGAQKTMDGPRSLQSWFLNTSAGSLDCFVL